MLDMGTQSNPIEWEARDLEHDDDVKVPEQQHITDVVSERVTGNTEFDAIGNSHNDTDPATLVHDALDNAVPSVHEGHHEMDDTQPSPPIPATDLVTKRHGGSGSSHNDYYIRSTTNSDIVALVMALVVAILVLPFALMFRLSPRFRAAILALHGGGLGLKSARKRSLDGTSPSMSSSSNGPAGGGGSSTSDLYEPRTVMPPNFRSILSQQDLNRLTARLPMRLHVKDWKLMYATELHGFNLFTAYRRVAGTGPCVVAVMDANRHVFAGFCTESLEVRGAMQTFGTGECFVASIHPEFKVFPWRPGNETHFVIASEEFVAFGGGGGMAIWLDSTFERGTSERCATYGTSKTIASQESFKCVAVEIWCFVTPSIREALTRSASMTVHGVLGRLTRKSSALGGGSGLSGDLV